MDTQSGGFKYTVSEEQIKKWMTISPKEKLEWLEEINELLRKAQTTHERDIMAKLRKGEI